MKFLKTNASQIFIYFSLSLMLSSCLSTEPLGIERNIYKGYMPTEPILAKTVEYYNEETGEYEKKFWESFTDSIKLKMLPLQSAQISMRKISMDGKISYMPASVSAEKGQYEVIMDYMKFRIEDVYKDTTYLGSGQVGIGLRIKASVITEKQNLNLGGLGSLGIEANNENINGILSIEITGVDSRDITNQIPLVVKLDETSIQYAMQAIATIKSKIWDDNVYITPHVIAVNQRKNNSENLIKESIAEIHVFSYTSSSQIIDKWIMPDGENYDTERFGTLKNWMKQNNVPAEAGDVNVFIMTDSWEEMRQKAIKDLNIK